MDWKRNIGTYEESGPSCQIPFKVQTMESSIHTLQYIKESGISTPSESERPWDVKISSSSTDSSKNEDQLKDSCTSSQHNVPHLSLQHQPEEAGAMNSAEFLNNQLQQQQPSTAVTFTRSHAIQHQPKVAGAMQFSTEASHFEQEFINLYNRETHFKTRDKVTATFDYLKTPSRQVYPRFVEVNYYQGDTCLKSDEYEPDLFNKNGNERYFTQKEFKLDKFLDGVRYTALVAGAGEGKTTAAKRFAQKILNKKIAHMNEIELIHYVSIAELDWEDRYTAYDLIFNQTMGSKVNHVKQFGCEWMKENARKVLLIFDGLDQAPWELGEANRTISYDKKATAPVIFHNILNKDLFHGCKILVTAREHAIRKCPGKFRPQRVLTLAGLRVKDREYLIKELGGEKGVEIWKHLNRKSPSLLSLCATPVYLILTVAIWVENYENPPDTMTGILIQVLVYFINSENQVSRNIEMILSKLTELAYRGTLRRQVRFHYREIRNIGLAVKDVTDLLIVTPGKSLRSRSLQLMEGTLLLHFFHQSMQEVLTALHIVKMPIHEFIHFVGDRFNDDHFLVVQHLVMGIMFNDEVNNCVNQLVIGEILYLKEKRSVLEKWILDKIHSDQNSVYSILHECGDGVDNIINQHFRTFNITQQLTKINLFHIFSVMSRCYNIDEASFSSVSPTEDQLELLTTAVKRCKHCKIGILNLRNTDLSLHHFVHIDMILNRSNVRLLQIPISCFTKKNVEKLQEPTSHAQLALEYLALTEDSTRPLDQENFYFLGKSLANWKAKSLILSKCKCSAGVLRNLLRSMKDFNVQMDALTFGEEEILNFNYGYQVFQSHNQNMGDEEFQLIAQIINQAKVQRINLVDCNFKMPNMEKFRQALDDPSKLEVIHERKIHVRIRRK